MADVILEITVPEAWVSKVLNAFNKITGTQMQIEAMGHPDGFDGRWSFTIAEKQPDENNKQFGERVLRELGIAVVNMVDIAEDSERYNTAVFAITPPASDVPTDILIQR